MFLLASGRHVRAHPDGHQHGVSIQISINLGKRFLRISRMRKIAVTWSLARVFHIYLLSFLRIWTSYIERFWFLFWSILNGVTLKTTNCGLRCRKKCICLFVSERKFRKIKRTFLTPSRQPLNRFGWNFTGLLSDSFPRKPCLRFLFCFSVFE